MFALLGCGLVLVSLLSIIPYLHTYNRNIYPLAFYVEVFNISDKGKLKVCPKTQRRL